ncbi:FAD:protein FMN transferase [Pseudobacter ginsenosidimutans]|uniref:FAD:protein FMN transferase n=1 Tax=Pseudobacter ginsenosidimutans TaxID=661488 RepID=A0A4Q7MQ61_9BACT|nr:FAD:protein FMN transferase [Pseudobacter ginsenosidimutans]QEC40519.1 FAD:protein FMN transferase [Pseudobacter ginsenosidimutans]RZS68869.1 thiamine biosynthesis lipoprotein [Pseudobacter ginsenosidimutans]
MRPILILLLIACCLAGRQPREKQPWKLTGFAQGTSWHISYYATDSIIAQAAVDSILTKLDSSLSIYKPWSLITRFNQCKHSLEIDEHLANVVRASFTASRNTYGIFDITIQPVTQAWGFGPIKVTKMPDTLTISNLMQCVDVRYLSLQGSTLIKQRPCVSIDVNGIAQGYSVDVLAGFVESKGIADYMIEIGGEIRLKGLKYPGAKPMKIGIEAPAESEFEPSVMQRIICPADGAVTTSGSYRKFFESGGQKVSHIIDARTGFPARNELISVTVWAADAITADAYDNALMAMGLEKALQYLQQHPEMAAYFIYREKDGRIADTASTFFNKFMSVE